MLISPLHLLFGTCLLVVCFVAWLECFIKVYFLCAVQPLMLLCKFPVTLAAVLGGGGGLPCLFPSSLLNWQPQGAPHAAASLGDLLVDFSIVFNIAPGHKLLSNHPIKCESFCRLVFEVCSKPRRALLSHSLPWFFFLILSGELVAGLSLSVFLS